MNNGTAVARKSPGPGSLPADPEEEGSGKASSIIDILCLWVDGGRGANGGRESAETCRDDFLAPVAPLANKKKKML